ncbi:MAG: NUDIX hydrolase [Candidatus Eremiobacteraeota bacterium]|nr:NUDIX hydrolase [Candidatus Eremiobacteraeota bacterium]
MSSVRLAATVILARPPFEVYLTRRSTRSAFAPNAFVFPGGTIEAQDVAPAAQARAAGLDHARLADEFRASVSPELISTEPPIDMDAARALLVAAVRELFEEAGVLLACTSSGKPIEPGGADWHEIAQARQQVRRGVVSFAGFLTGRGWYADARALRLFSHWITPPSEPRRYNTHFFFAAAPPDQAALADAFETHDGVWIAPRDALERFARDDMHLVYPTVKHLERLAAFDSVESALRFARAKPVVTVMPHDAGDDFQIPPSLETAW